MKKILRKIYIVFLKIRLKKRYSNVLAVSFINDYKKVKSINNFFVIYFVHKKGFTYKDWNALHLNKKNYKNYLSNIDYYSLHPLNGIYSKWIDDKLTLKYLCSGTILDQYMPRYYFQIDSNGKILKLMDYEIDKDNYSVDDIKKLLKNHKTLAIKLLNGSCGVGFYKAEYKNKKLYLNDKEVSESEFDSTILSLYNYIVTEYFNPCEFFSQYSNKCINSIRVLVGRVDGKLQFFYSFLKLGTNKSGVVDNYHNGGILCLLDKNGNYKEGNILINGENIKIKKHPDNNLDLKGTIPFWNSIMEAINQFDKYFPQLEYLGFDFVINDKNEIKILEINSLGSLDALQFEKSIYDSDFYNFFDNRMKIKK